LLRSQALVAKEYDDVFEKRIVDVFEGCIIERPREIGAEDFGSERAR
jgi:hypothetical protein